MKIKLYRKTMDKVLQNVGKGVPFDEWRKHPLIVTQGDLLGTQIDIRVMEFSNKIRVDFEMLTFDKIFNAGNMFFEVEDGESFPEIDFVKVLAYQVSLLPLEVRMFWKQRLSELVYPPNDDVECSDLQSDGKLVFGDGVEVPCIVYYTLKEEE